MKKFLSVCLSVVLVISSTVLFNANASNDIEKTYVDTVSPIYYDPTQAIKETQKNNSDFKIKPYLFNSSSEEAQKPYNFYTFLNENQKALYDAILADKFAASGVYEVFFPQPISLSSTTAQDDFQKVFYGAVTALNDDHPELFWLIMQYKMYTYSNSSQILGIALEPNYNGDSQFLSPYSNMLDCENKYNQMMSVVDSFEIKGNTRYEKLKNIHDFIAKRVVYDPNLGKTGENPTDHEPTSVFLEPYTTVCEGYAEAFKILCNKAEIPCVVVVGHTNDIVDYVNGVPVYGGHAWNYVKMEDNKWYAVDLTWDDQGVICYDFFLVGSSSTNKYFDGDSTTFSYAHTPMGQRYNIDIFTLTYPNLNFSAYSRMILNIDSEATVTKTNMRLFIPGNSTVSSQVDVPYGYVFDTPIGNKTGSTLNVRNTSNIIVETYTVIMRGDVVADATVNSLDYNKVKDTSVLKPGSLSEGSVQYEAGDLNGDGVIDAFDTALLDLQINAK